MSKNIIYENAKNEAIKNGFRGVVSLNMKWNGYEIFRPYLKRPDEMHYLGFGVIVIANNKEARFPVLEEVDDIVELFIAAKKKETNDV